MLSLLFTLPFLPTLCTAKRCDPDDVRKCLSEFEVQFLASDPTDLAAQCELVITQGSVCFDGCPKSALDQFVSTYADGVCQKAEAQSLLGHSTVTTVRGIENLVKPSSAPMLPLGDSKYPTSHSSEKSASLGATDSTTPTLETRPLETRGRLSRLMESWWKSKSGQEKDLENPDVQVIEPAGDQIEQWGKAKLSKYSELAHSMKTALKPVNLTDESERNILKGSKYNITGSERARNYTGPALILSHKAAETGNGTESGSGMDSSPINTVLHTMTVLVFMVTGLLLL